jgi:hypothetical protein
MKLYSFFGYNISMINSIDLYDKYINSVCLLVVGLLRNRIFIEVLRE